MKINKIEVQNFKAVSDQSINFKGCSAIITGGNNKGKTSFLRGLIDRFRGEKPNPIVKEGESKGLNVIELSDGSKIEWKFTEKGETFAYITKEGFRQTTSVLTALGERYFGIKFDIDSFLSSGPQVQTKELQKIVGLDFSEIDLHYQEAYSNRTDANREFARVSGLKKAEPGKVEKPNVDILKQDLDKTNSENTKLIDDWVSKNNDHQNEIYNFNANQTSRENEYKKAIDAVSILDTLGFSDKNLDSFLGSLKPEPFKEVTSLPKPSFKDTSDLELALEQGNGQQRLFDSYERDLKEYNDWVSEGLKAREAQIKADEKVKSIQSEKNKMIAGAKIPEEFEITDSGILYNGFPLTNMQQSSSSKYIAALKLGSMVLGELRTMHFDASFLDKNSLAEIQDWANKNDLQLLIERPDFDGGEIKYEIIS